MLQVLHQLWNPPSEDTLQVKLDRASSNMMRGNHTSIAQLFHSYGVTPNGGLIDDGREAQLARREEELCHCELEYHKQVAKFEQMRVTLHQNEAQHHARMALIHKYQAMSGKELGLTHRLVVDTEESSELTRRLSENLASLNTMLDIS